MKTENNNIIRLEEFRVEGAKVFTGRDRGQQVRNESKLDEIADKYEDVEFIIPDNVYSINPSFFEELFLNVVLKFGRERFLKKFHFKSEGDYNFQRSLNEAIDRILRNKTALG